MARKQCANCGEVHGMTPSVVNKWHMCTNCGSYYCPDCGKSLERAGMASRERLCPKCGHKTKLVD